eukprot:5318649-Amphidinium_carterae.1
MLAEWEIELSSSRQLAPSGQHFFRSNVSCVDKATCRLGMLWESASHQHLQLLFGVGSHRTWAGKAP